MDRAVVSIDRGKVRLGIKAPQAVSIMRAELLIRGTGPASCSLCQ